jgi:hypothetical protein
MKEGFMKFYYFSGSADGENEKKDFFKYSQIKIRQFAAEVVFC